MIINDRHHNHRDFQKKMSRLRLQKTRAFDPSQKIKEGRAGRRGIKKILNFFKK